MHEKGRNHLGPWSAWHNNCIQQTIDRKPNEFWPFGAVVPSITCSKKTPKTTVLWKNARGAQNQRLKRIASKLIQVGGHGHHRNATLRSRTTVSFCPNIEQSSRTLLSTCKCKTGPVIPINQKPQGKAHVQIALSVKHGKHGELCGITGPPSDAKEALTCWDCSRGAVSFSKAGLEDFTDKRCLEMITLPQTK